MNFYITDDDEVFRSMLSQIIEDEELGEVVGEAQDGFFLDANTLEINHVDILFIDLLMPLQDGIETIRRMGPSFKGKIIMISQVESKELIGEAYSLGIEYYITKPLNKIEVISVVRKVLERIRLERSILDIQKSLSNVFDVNSINQHKPMSSDKKKITDWGQVLLSELGIAGENGSKDLLDMLNYLYEYETNFGLEAGFPTLKDIYIHISLKKLGIVNSQEDVERERKSSEQRVRRAIYQSLNHMASIGLTDFANPKFENYASKFFDFETVRQRMSELKQVSLTPSTHTRINAKKFIQVLYFESKQLLVERY
ncbi:response regulator [Gottfriedia sp. NPDC057991]|uniref:response regulator n=1 Tax=Gottfriedia sp. NPDC057991 TaxID=3346298 RepID=UPI0036DC5A74